jgi:hypothetical protein
MFDGIISLVAKLVDDMPAPARAFTVGLIFGTLVVGIPAHLSIQSLQSEKKDLIKALEEQKHLMINQLQQEKLELMRQLRKD